MFLLINIGNTRTVFAEVKNDKVENKLYFYTKSELMHLKTVLLKTAKTEKIDGIIISSVVPSALKLISEFINIKLSIEPLIVKYANLHKHLKINIDNPKSLGADRLANTMGALKHYGTGLIIVDMGTATTFEVIDHNGTYVGGLIAAGMLSQLDSLYSSTALLPEIELEKPSSLIATDVTQAMRSGVFWGYISMVEGIISRIQLEHQGSLKVIATGGVLSIVLDEITKIDYKDSDLLIKGLIEIYGLFGKR